MLTHIKIKFCTTPTSIPKFGMNTLFKRKFWNCNNRTSCMLTLGWSPLFCGQNFIKWSHSVADPGFPRGGAPTPRGGANLWFCQFSLKTAWKRRIFGRRGGGVPCAPPLRSATAIHVHCVSPVEKIGRYWRRNRFLSIICCIYWSNP